MSDGEDMSRIAGSLSKTQSRIVTKHLSPRRIMRKSARPPGSPSGLPLSEQSSIAAFCLSMCAKTKLADDLMLFHERSSVLIDWFFLSAIASPIAPVSPMLLNERSSFVTSVRDRFAPRWRW
jgi:hypothetical protein